MPSRKFPDTGTRLVLLESGRRATNVWGYLYEDEALTVPAEVYYDVDGVQGTQVAADAYGRVGLRLNAFGEQVDYWGPQDGTAELWIVVNGVASKVNADYNPRVAALESQVGGLQPALPSGTTSQFLRGDKTFVAVTKSTVGLPNVDDTSDANKPISTATATALAGKAPTANPTFTGTVAGVSKTHVGLGNVDNTADTAKPVSTAQQTAINLRVAKDQQPVNVKDWGAVGDGVADDTTSLGQALYTASQTGRAVLLPPGTYNYTALSLTAPLHGSGRGRTTLRGPSIQMSYANTSLRDISVIGTQPVIVNSLNSSKLSIDGCDFSHATGLGITNHLAVAWSSVADSQISHCRFGIGGVQLTAATNFLIDGNFWDCEYANVNEPCHVSQKSSGQFVNNTVTRTATDALDLYSSGEYCVVANNRFLGLGGNAGMELKITLSDDVNNSSAVGNIIDGVVVANNVFRDFRGPTTNGRAGIFAEYVDSRAVKSFSHTLTARALIIDGNILEDFEPVSPGAIVPNWTGIAFTGHNCRISNNVIRNMRSWNNSVNYGIRLALYGAGVADGVKCTGVAVSGNTIAGIDGNGSAGIATGSLEQCHITDNIIRGDEPAGTITKWGMDVGTGATLVDTRISGNLFHCNNAASIGLRLVGAGSKLSKCQLVGNVFRDCHWAINVAENTIFANNTVDNALNSQAPYVGVAGTASTGNVYTGNHITMSADHALVLTDHEQFTIDACVFRDTFSGVLLVGATRNGIVNGCVSVGQSNLVFPTYSGVSAGDQASISVGINRVNSGASNVTTGSPATATTVAVTGLSALANTTTTTTVTLTGATTADQVLIVPQAALPAGVSFSHAYVSAANTLTVAFSNATASPVSVTVNLQAITLRRYL